MSEWLMTGFALMLMFEGVMPFVAPDLWKRTLLRLAQMPPNQLRIVGLFSMLAGLAILNFSGR